MSVPTDPPADSRQTEDPDRPGPGADDVDRADAAPSRPAVDKATLDRVFGDVLPETTSDERDLGGAGRGTDRDSWYRENRPPHHGG
jgi:hypothetical protein